jgi:hypothetical protein
MSRVATR